MNTQHLNYKDYFSFKLDKFQIDAIKSLQENNNVLVCAPTGSGKTAIAEYAIHNTANSETYQKIFYTSPLKALSNQKYYDLCKLFGEDKVGLLTGDQQINRLAPILVMTTEIFRNILYKEDSDLLENLKYVILDECHFMRDPHRGTVWEECIIHCPQDTQIIGLSATIGNPKSLAKWMSKVHRNTELIISNYRPVPLRHYYLGRNGMKPLTTPEGNFNKNLLKTYFQTKSKKHKNNRRNKSQYLPQLHDILIELHQKDLLPAIYFQFSRRACEQSMLQAAKLNTIQPLNILTPTELRELNFQLDDACNEMPWLRVHRYLDALRAGIACHHAGLLPALKNLIENLFQQNLIKVIFATETLAAGINMPARSTIISQVSKKSDNGFRTLTASEFLQMSGRAGRRGFDTTGYTIILENPYEGLADIATLIKAKPEDLHSAFTANYTMVLNLAIRFDFKQAYKLITKSFARYEISQEIDMLKKQLNTIKSPKKLAKLERHIQYLNTIPWAQFEKTTKVLEEFQYVDSNFELTESGKWAADLRMDNVLFIAELIKNNIFQEFTVSEFAGFVTALSSYDIKYHAESTILNTGSLTSTLTYQVESSYKIIKKISSIQEKHGLELNIPFNPKLINIGYDWSLADNWNDMLDKYPVDEGDLVKIIKQTIDILKQLLQCPALTNTEYDKIKETYNILWRSPISDV